MPVTNDSFTDEQKQAFENDETLLRNMQSEETYVKAVMRFTDAITDANSCGIQELQSIVLGNLEDSVEDPELREKLRPDYVVACKRLVYSPDYYQAIQHTNSELVTEEIERIDAAGVWSRDGKLHELDVLVLATGYEVGRFIRPAEVIGRNGLKLNDVWENGPTAYMAISVPNFPNFAMLNGPTGPVGNFSLIDIAEHQWNYIAQLIDLVHSGAYREVSASEEALDDYNTRRVQAAPNTVFASGCSSWYIGVDGVPITWPWSYDRFVKEMKAPKLEAFELI
jgi:cation diffusion facilitator CzcD-associated flavoprotein CzcO